MITGKYTGKYTQDWIKDIHFQMSLIRPPTLKERAKKPNPICPLRNPTPDAFPSTWKQEQKRAKRKPKPSYRRYPKNQPSQRRNHPGHQINGSKERNYIGREEQRKKESSCSPHKSARKKWESITGEKKRGHCLYFLAARFLVAVFAGGGAVVLVTRPDLVLLMILGCSTTAGAWGK